MVFSSLSFIFFLIACTCCLYFICKNRTYRNAVLLFASLVFYSWGEPKYLVNMILVCLIAYAGGLLIDKYSNKEKTHLSKGVFVITTILVLSNLFVFKYFNFTVYSANRFLGLNIKAPEILLPIGISFYTFQILSYVIDLYRKEIDVQKNFFKLLLYLSFFPQLIAGPIVRYSTVCLEISNRRENADDIFYGTKRFIIGLSKKVLIANGCAKFAEMIYLKEMGSYSTYIYWLAALAYTLEIYFDFSGYSDMAIGLGRIFGFHFLENFDHPYIATSITEFWRRWHISLSSWFRDYVYIPLGGNRVSVPRYILNIFTVWALTGLWHGASWNFVLWGLYYAILLCVEKFLFKTSKKKKKGIGAFFSWLITFFFVNIGWVIFNITSLSKLKTVFIAMFTPNNVAFIDMLAMDSGLLSGLMYIPLGLIFMLPVGKLFTKKNGRGAIMTDSIICLVLLVLCMVLLISSSYNPFIYFRF